MQTPDTEAGKLTEKIMMMFWANPVMDMPDTATYNKIYERILRVLTEYFEGKKPR